MAENVRAAKRFLEEHPEELSKCVRGRGVARGGGMLRKALKKAVFPPFYSVGKFPLSLGITDFISISDIPAISVQLTANYGRFCMRFGLFLERLYMGKTALFIGLINPPALSTQMTQPLDLFFCV